MKKISFKIGFAKKPSARNLTIVPFLDLRRRLPGWTDRSMGSFMFDSRNRKILFSLGKIDHDPNRSDLFSHFVELFAAFNEEDNLQINLDLLIQKIKMPLREGVAFLVRAWFLSAEKRVSYKSKSKEEETERKNAPASRKRVLFLISDLDRPIGFVKIINDEEHIAKAIIQARKWQDLPPNKLTTTSFVSEIKSSFAGLPNTKLEILETKDLEREKMNLLLSVNAGSPLPAYLAVVDYNPTGDKKTPVYYALVGKGVVFDSGGYSLKPSSYMKSMKFDMSGAAIALMTIKLAAQLDTRARLVAIVPLVSNLIGSKATVVDSVIKSRSGKSVEITNTDAEGRLILADAMTYALEKFDPRHLITIATLTGAIVYALGEKTSGVFCPRGELGKSFVAASRENWEEAWMLPITADNRKNMRASRIADLINASEKGAGGAASAAAFLDEFATPHSFLHLDIAGSATSRSRGTGVLIPSLFAIVKKKILKKSND